MQPQNIILEGIVGSKAYGTAHAESDIDVRGVFITPTSVMTSLFYNAHEEKSISAGPDNSTDYTYHEIGRVLRMLVKSTPSVLELLWLDEYTSVSDEGHELIQLRNCFLSTDTVRNTFGHAAKGNFWSAKPKGIGHGFRVLEQGYSLLTTGELEIKYSNPAEYLEMRNGSRLDYEDLFKEKLAELESAPSVLPDEQKLTPIHDFLYDIRKNYF